MIAWLLFAALAGASELPAPKTVDEAVSALKTEESPKARAALAAALAQEPLRGKAALKALGIVMKDDFSHEVRKAAVRAALAYEGSQALDLLEEFLKGEQASGVRADAAVELSTAAAQKGNPRATDILAALLLEDESPEVRRAAARGLERRGDRRALGSVEKASKADPNPEVRQTARKTLRTLEGRPRHATIPVRPAKNKKAPYDSVKGKDKCGRTQGWCECEVGPVKIKPRCLTLDECRHRYRTVYQHQGYTCAFDGSAVD